MLAIIGGTGFNAISLPALSGMEELDVDTALGKPSGKVFRAHYSAQGANTDVLFLARHGNPHAIPPHLINYRANLLALQELGATKIVAVNAVGGIAENIAPASLCIPDQIIDYTYGREHTYFDGIYKPLDHVDFTLPYCRELRSALISVARSIDLPVIASGTYAATQGPRLESAAEIKRLKHDGATLVGMTGMPEAALAKELSLSYACIALSVNWAAGIKSDDAITMDEIRMALEKGMSAVMRLIAAYIEQASC